MRRPGRLTALLAVLVIASAAQSLWAQEEGEEEEEEEEVERGPLYGTLRPQDGAEGEWAPGFHPNYQMTHTRDQDVLSWKHGFTMNYPLSRKISFRSSSNITIRENTVLNRENRQETWRAGLDLRMSDAITTGLKFTRTNQEDVRNKGKPGEVRSFRERESVNLTTDYKKVYLNDVGVTLGVSGGFEKNEYADVRSTGSSQNVNAGIRYVAPLGISTDFHYNGSHSLLDSKQGALDSMDESVEHSLTGHADYSWMGNSFSVDMRRGTSSKEYPKEEQTENRRGNTESIDVKTDLGIIEDLTMSVGLSYSRSRTTYKIEPAKDNDLKGRSVDASIAYALGETRFTAELRSEKKRNDYFDAQTGDTYTDSFGASLTHGFGEDFTVALRGRTSLLSHHYEDVSNDQDRDLFDQEGTLQVDYTPRDDIRTSLTVKLREDNLIYIRTSRTGDNKTSQTYAVKPLITKQFGSSVSLTQKYELSADYTFYTYDPDSNFLIRSFAVNTTLDWRPFDPLALSVGHRYRSQDEGAYVEDDDGVEKYSRNSERDDNNLILTVRYKLFGFVNLEVSQNLSIQKKWKIDGDEKDLSWEKFATTLSGSARTDYELPSGTKLKFTVGRTYRDATNILDRQREVWDISVNIDKTF